VVHVRPDPVRWGRLGSVTLMMMTRRSWGLLCLVLACDSGGEAAGANSKAAPAEVAQADPQRDDAPAQKPKTAPASAEVEPEAPNAVKADPLKDLPEPPAAEPASEPEPEPAGDPPAAVEPPGDPAQDPAADLPPRERAIIPVTAVAATSVEAPWREVARPSEAVAFEVLIRGVLGKSTGGYWDVSEQGQLVLRPEIQAPNAKIIGTWPNNAWSIETRVKIDPRDRADDGVTQVRLMRLRGNRRWVPQEYNYEQRWEDDGQRIVMAAKGGILVEHRGTIERVAGNAEAPEFGQTLGPNIVAFFETRKGRVYTVERVDDELLALRECEDLECADLSAVKFPSGARWAFTSPVPRQNNSISAVATLHEDGGDKAHVLHYEAGGWKLDALPGAPMGLWPTKDGGLWTMVAGSLLHRDPDGAWRSVELPDGASSVTAAMRGDFSELWIAATVGGSTVVYATHARAQLPPPEPEPAAVAG